MDSKKKRYQAENKGGNFFESSAWGADKGTLKNPQLHLQWIVEEKNHHHGHYLVCDSSVCVYE